MRSNFFLGARVFACTPGLGPPCRQNPTRQHPRGILFVQEHLISNCVNFVEAQVIDIFRRVPDLLLSLYGHLQRRPFTRIFRQGNLDGRTRNPPKACDLRGSPVLEILRQSSNLLINNKCARDAETICAYKVGPSWERLGASLPTGAASGSMERRFETSMRRNAVRNC